MMTLAEYVLSLKPVLLWTDLMVFILLGMAIVFSIYAGRKAHSRQAWRQVFRRRLSMASAVVLSVYVGIGLLDSLHFREPLVSESAMGDRHYSVEVVSALDLLLSILRRHGEKTYSAPFATHGYSKELLSSSSEETAWDYPRLDHGGAHLESDDDKAADIGRRLFKAVVVGGILWGGVVAAFIAFLARRRRASWMVVFREVFRGESELPWNVMLLVCAILVLLATSATQLAPYYHVFGTDKVGQDVLYQTLKSIRTALVIGTLTTLVMLPFAVMLGITAGYLRGWVDDAVQYLYTTLNSIPGVLLIASAVLMLQVYIDTHPDLFETDAARADIRLFFLCVILGVTSWTGLCRLLRGEAMKLGGVEYVQAAAAFGVGPVGVMVRHLLPNVLHIILISIVLDFSGLVLAEAVLSYVGVGVDPSMNSWGNMINSARLEIARDPVVWWSLLAAFAFMFVLVLAANLFSDAVRDAFDPRLRHRQ